MQTLLWRALRRMPHAFTVRRIADARPFQPGDRVLLRPKLDRNAQPILTKPLKPGSRVDSHRGALNHGDLIGKRVRDVVRTAPSQRTGKEGTEYRLYEVRLEEYVRLSRRLVTPIYPADAALIVGELDLHPEVYDPDSTKSEEDNSKLEILEAGTGHGALTLYLSRAVHAANPPIPSLTSVDPTEDLTESEINPLEAWKPTRRAVIHTIDVSAKYSAHAQNVVKGFKHGLYYSNVDFYVTDVGTWTNKTLSERHNAPFLSHAILDLPDVHEKLGIVSQALRCDGCVVVFCPSITQIMDCQRRVKEDGTLLELEKVLELGVNGGSGGREWDVRAVRPRARQRESNRAVEEAESGNGHDVEAEISDDVKTSAGSENEDATENDDHAVEEESKPSKGDWSMVCRPKVGERIIGGGFLGIWRKQRSLYDV